SRTRTRAAPDRGSRTAAPAAATGFFAARRDRDPEDPSRRRRRLHPFEAARNRARAGRRGAGRPHGSGRHGAGDRRAGRGPVKLSELLRGIDLPGPAGPSPSEPATESADDPDVRGVAHDSRAVVPGDLFAAWIGARY